MNIIEFADKIGVSRTTVSRAIHGTGRISPATRTMVLKRMEELGYHPNHVARALVTGQSHVVSLWSRCLHHLFYTQVVYYVGAELEASGFDMIIKDVTSCMNTYNGYTDQLLRWSVDGVLAIDCPQYVTAYVKANQNRSIPIVSFGAFHTEQVDSVGCDLASGSTDAMHHLYEIGCRRIAYLALYKAINPNEPKWNAYKKFMDEAGLKTECIVTPEETRVAARQATSDYVKDHGAPDAIFCHCDDLVTGVFHGLRDQNFHVPEDVVLVGCDGTEDAEYFNPSITTIVQPVKEMCTLACQFMHNRIEDPSLPLQHVVLKPRLAIRQSSTR